MYIYIRGTDSFSFRRLLKTRLFSEYLYTQRIGGIILYKFTYLPMVMVIGNDMAVYVASRLGRRPKRLKNASPSESQVSKPATSVKPHMIAPQPPQLGLLPLSMAELQVRVLHYLRLYRLTDY